MARMIDGGMTDRDKVIKGLECCTQDYRPNCADCYQQGPGFGFTCRENLMRDALALLKEYDEALKLMVYQYCTMAPLTISDKVFHNKYMSAGEAAFRLLELENGQSTDGVWERWFPNG